MVGLVFVSVFVLYFFIYLGLFDVVLGFFLELKIMCAYVKCIVFGQICQEKLFRNYNSHPITVIQI